MDTKCCRCGILVQADLSERWRKGETTAGRGRPVWDIRAPRSERSSAPRGGLHAGRAKLVQVQTGRGGRVLRPLFTFRRGRLFLALAGYG
jgi:hypothetical protein